MSGSPQETHLSLARASLQQALSWYGQRRRFGHIPPNTELSASMRGDVQAIASALDKLERKAIRIATFGLVSRGKSAVVNALVGEKVMPTGPLHGVTRWPQTVRWMPPSGKLQVELIDTPGLDEISGEERATMAAEVARQSDLILFVVAGDITRTEYRALCELRAAQKPILLVFNKIDLYPETDRAEIYGQLQQLGAGNSQLTKVLSEQEIALVAAEPGPIQVRLETSAGEISYQWETPPPEVDDLRTKVLQILNREGRSLLALNALVQGKEAEMRIARKTLEGRQGEAEALIWKYARYKAIAVAVNPIAIADVLGGAIADLALIRSLARLYGLPVTNNEAGKLLRRILLSSGGLLLSELGSNALLGLGKSAIAFSNPGGIVAYSGVGIVQGGVAGYGAYAIGKVAQEYLERGCSWGPMGPSTAIRDILDRVDSDTIVYRLRQELGQQFHSH